jgi:tetratricopeptide (TPR) repeat protein
MLGLCYREILEPEKAIPLFEKVLRRNPRHVQALYYLGACYLQIGNTPLGKAYLRRYDHLVRQMPVVARPAVRDRRAMDSPTGSSPQPAGSGTPGSSANGIR